MFKAPSAAIIMTEDELRDLIASTAKATAKEVAARLPIQTKPRPLHVTQTQAAEMVNVSRATIAKMVSFGTFRLNEFGMIPIEQIDAALEAKAA